MLTNSNPLNQHITLNKLQPIKGQQMTTIHLKKQAFKLGSQYQNAIESAKLMSQKFDLIELEDYCKADPTNDIYLEALEMKIKRISK